MPIDQSAGLLNNLPQTRFSLCWVLGPSLIRTIWLLWKKSKYQKPIGNIIQGATFLKALFTRFECEIQGQLKLGYNSNAYLGIAKITLDLADKINSVSSIFRLGLLHLATKEVGRVRKANPQNQWSWTLTMNI